MRVFWLTILATGLLLITIDTYDATQSSSAQSAPCRMDDGTGVPTPTPTPIAK